MKQCKASFLRRDGSTQRADCHAYFTKVLGKEADLQWVMIHFEHAAFHGKAYFNGLITWLLGTGCSFFSVPLELQMGLERLQV